MENSKKRFGLSRYERIKSKKDFEKIFSEGEILFSSDKKIRALYIIEQKPPAAGIKIGTAVKKQYGNAVWRNRIKRLLKESFRLNKDGLVSSCTEKNILIKIIFAFIQSSSDLKTPRLMDIMPGVLEVMYILRKRL
ncbi:MAG TPA: ribonuclease P protein component [Ignavibacteriaceae bacterium]|nr:ribonuclease P protein component [Ignavibacteriaceae bacterium]